MTRPELSQRDQLLAMIKTNKSLGISRMKIYNQMKQWYPAITETTIRGRLSRLKTSGIITKSGGYGKGLFKYNSEVTCDLHGDKNMILKQKEGKLCRFCIRCEKFGPEYMRKKRNDTGRK